MGGQIFLHAVSVAQEALRIAQVVMGQITVIECIVIVVIRFAPIAQAIELIADGEVI